jgi:DNA topoisomerase I
VWGTARILPFVAGVTLLEIVAGEGASPDELVDPAASADAAGLRYVTDERPGIRRRKAGRSFTYLKPDDSRVTDDATLRRIKSLAIPPAWTSVWICPSAHGHLQATGRDARGRKQYRYHPHWRTLRDAVKYDRMVDFANVLPAIRERVDHDLSLPGLPREKVLAAVVRLLEQSRIRIGNEEYKKLNRSFGLTTLQDRHVQVEGGRVRFRFKGKSGKEHDVEIADRRLARIVRRCRDIPGQDLFQYVNGDGTHHDVTSGDVNDYIREIAGGEFTAKDFRTWAGTLLAARFFSECEPAATEQDGKKTVVRCIEVVASELGNTVAVCRKCYVHPKVIEAYTNGALTTVFPPAAAATNGGTGAIWRATKDARSPYALSDEEAALVDLLCASEAAMTKQDSAKRAA